jgi:serine/threonine protein kinase
VKLQAYAEEILEGIRYIHNEGIIHDDIKLENILMQTPEYKEEFLQAKICDFGFSQTIDPQSGQAYFHERRGTMGYIAPEIQNVNLFL